MNRRPSDYIHRLQFHRRNIDNSILIKLIIEALPYYEKKYGNGSKADFIMKKFIRLSETKAKQAIIVAENAEQADIIKILHNEATIRAIYNKISLNKIKKSAVTFLMTKMIIILFVILIMGVFTLKIMKNGRKKRCLHCLNF